VALFFAATLFVSAFLLFLVQPMVGKMVLPLLGGTPAVWSTCMVFFQALLLAGYTYAHTTPRRFGLWRQSLLHLFVLALPLVAMGIMVVVTGSPVNAIRSLAPQGTEYPFFGIVVLLLVMIGLPFFVVATSAPLLQSWFSKVGHRSSADPYFLYAASNLGSLLALIAYPAVIEPSLTLAHQAWLWAAGYLLLIVLTAGCARRLWDARRGQKEVYGDKGKLTPRPPLTDRLRWLALAFVPSSLMLGVTQYAAIDIASIPLLWIIPLGLYLMTFIIAFGRHPEWLPRVTELLGPVFILMLIFLMLTGLKPPSFNFDLFLHFLVFTMVALFCHVELAQRRPSAEHLTEFYLWVSLGGVFGGLFNALISPLIFRDLTEYPLVLIAAGLLLPARDESRSARSFAFDLITPVILAGVVMVLYLCFFDDFPAWLSYPGRQWFDEHCPSLVDAWKSLVTKLDLAVNWTSDHLAKWTKQLLTIEPASLQKLSVFGLPALVAFYFVDRPLRFGLSVLAIWLVGQATINYSSPIHQERSFFGVLKVQFEKREGNGPNGEGEYHFHKLVHGGTTHGSQFWDPALDIPLTYYHQTGPVGLVFDAFKDGPKAKKNFAFIGLGTGSLAAYGKPGMKVTIYEIDPAVRRLSTNSDYFTFYNDCKADKQIVMGDARLMIETAPDGAYDVIFVDAFSSDAIPVHLLTKESIALYLRKLAPDGIIMLHISNRYLRLQPVCARLMQEHRLAGVIDYDNYTAPWLGKLPAQWVALARSKEHFGPMLTQMCQDVDKNDQVIERQAWSELEVPKDAPLWTDDFSNLLQIYEWPEWPDWLPWAKKSEEN
jgi:hypothetical protein